MRLKLHYNYTASGYLSNITNAVPSGTPTTVYWQVTAQDAASRYQFDSPEDQALWQALKNKRMELAREQGVPPYVIFHDTTLLEMLEQRPARLSQFAAIPGVGKQKLEHYGAEFLEVLAEYA